MVFLLHFTAFLFLIVALVAELVHFQTVPQLLPFVAATDAHGTDVRTGG